MNKFLTLTGLSYFLDKIKDIFVGAASGTTEGNIVTFGADGKTITDSGHNLDEFAKKADISTVFRYSGTVDTYVDLPTDAAAGDVYNVTMADSANGIKAGDNVVWNGTEWDNLSGVIDFDASEITNEEIDTIFT